MMALDLRAQNRVLVLAPHTDDGEFGCGGTIAKIVAKGGEIYYAAFSLAEESVPPPWPKDVLETEVRAATTALGIPSDHLLLYRYRVRNFAEHRQSILDDLVTLQKKLNPSLVFMPCLHDLHQDHGTVAAEGLRAFKRTSILAYEVPWNNLNFATQCFVALEAEHLERKVAALNCYESQKERYYASEDFIRSLARTRGTQIGQRFAECFEVIRWVL